MADYQDAPDQGLDPLLAPTEDEARALAQARLRALQRRLPGAAALALTPDPGARALGMATLEAPEKAQELELRRGALGVSRQVAEQGRWQPLVDVDPNTGQRFVWGILDAKTGEIQQVSRQGRGGAATAGGGIQGLPPMKLSTEQGKMAGAVGGVSEMLKVALRVGFPRSGIAGVPQGIGQMLSQRGLPGLASPEAQQTYAAWYNVIRPLVNIRTGQQMAVQELEREFAALAPRPGEDPRTMLMKVHNMIPLMRYYTLGLPPALKDAMNAEYDRAERSLPNTVQELEAMRATGSGGLGPRSPAAREDLPDLGVYPLPPPEQQMTPSHQPQEGTVGGRRVIFRR